VSFRTSGRGGTNRFIREQKEKQEAAERYRKLHLQGKTEEAKNDLHRLAQIRAEREAALAKRKAEAGGEFVLFEKV